uniref:(northern house mosquito) hypothetical protein n=1 Tax=Culex pipiens TaxID=7175 RepID=A0A8D8C2Q5_CULPI
MASAWLSTRRPLCKTSTTVWPVTWRRCAPWRKPTRSWSARSGSGTIRGPQFPETTATIMSPLKICARKSPLPARTMPESSFRLTMPNWQLRTSESSMRMNWLCVCQWRPILLA